MTPPDTLPAPSSTIAWADPARAEAFARWLAAVAPPHGLAPATLRLASADASFRRYFRIDAPAMPGGSAIVMDAPPDKEDSRPFVQIASLMADAGLRAPRVLAWDAEHGFLLLDDLGRRTMLDVIDPADGAAALPLYRKAIDALVAWQVSSRPAVLPVYDEALLRRELALFPEWYLGAYRQVKLEGADAATLASAFDQIVARNLAAPQVFVHRDFMPRNLMVDDHDPAAPLGVLDFQDAVYGPITYDIASLMRDAFLSWDEDLVIDVTVRYWEAARKAGLPVGDDFGAFYAEVEWMGLQRHLKVAGIFARLTLRDGKPRYLADTPRFIGYIRSTCDRYRALGPLLKVLDRIEGTEVATGYAFGRV
ncbi:aminoglycoside phosphotransferase family protein [Xylophilus sp. GOD-11R]|uniref:aminoglycoside phosphotransferase family protein n=1 Tax=Xylophilus sp. GOD-11R TaxID=3089814 RepID=UPI00298BD5F8|nr:phosphotransferase [Xylophilus sp. GOD-11R]WPB57061.1 phosphotransferase [Xylophilus sp. GOD-11R]